MPLFGKKEKPVPQNQEIPPDIRTYLDNLLTEAGIVSIQGEQREIMIQELYVRLDKYLAIKLMDALPTAKLVVFNLTKKNSSLQDKQDYLQKNVPNVQDVFLKAFTDFRNIYLGKEN